MLAEGDGAPCGAAGDSRVAGFGRESQGGGQRRLGQTQQAGYSTAAQTASAGAVLTVA